MVWSSGVEYLIDKMRKVFNWVAVVHIKYCITTCWHIQRVQEKKETKMSDSDEIWYTVYWINLLQNNLNISHLTWIMSLPLWNLKCSLRTCYRWVVTERNSRIYSEFGLQICQIWVKLITACENVARGGVQNTSLIWSYKWRYWQMASLVTT